MLPRSLSVGSREVGHRFYSFSTKEKLLGGRVAGRRNLHSGDSTTVIWPYTEIGYSVRSGVNRVSFFFASLRIVKRGPDGLPRFESVSVPKGLLNERKRNILSHLLIKLDLQPPLTRQWSSRTWSIFHLLITSSEN